MAQGDDFSFEFANGFAVDGETARQGTFAEDQPAIERCCQMAERVGFEPTVTF